MKIKFETSIGVFTGDVTNDLTKEVELENDYWKFKKHLDFYKIFILDDNWIKIELTDPFYGYPEYKYEIIC